MKTKINVTWNGDSTDIRFERVSFDMLFFAFKAWVQGKSWTVRTPTKVWDAESAIRDSNVNGEAA